MARHFRSTDLCLLIHCTAAEIASNEGAMDVQGDEILEVRDIDCEHLNRQEKLNSYPTENNHNDIRSRLQHLEVELSSVLHTLRSKTGELLSRKVSDLIFLYINLGKYS